VRAKVLTAPNTPLTDAELHLPAPTGDQVCWPATSGCSSALMPVHSQALPEAHCAQRRQGPYQERTAWSPGRRSSTAGPTASTTPAPSCPSTSGSGTVHSPSAACRSEWPTPLASSSTSSYDHAFEAIGKAATIEAVPKLVKRGGQAVIVGMPAEGVSVSLDPFDLAEQGRRIFGCNYGSSVPSVDFPRLARLCLAGALPLDRLVGRRRDLDGADAALQDLRDAVGLRTVPEYA